MLTMQCVLMKRKTTNWKMKCYSGRKFSELHFSSFFLFNILFFLLSIVYIRIYFGPFVITMILFRLYIIKSLLFLQNGTWMAYLDDNLLILIHKFFFMHNIWLYMLKLQVKGLYWPWCILDVSDVSGFIRFFMHEMVWIWYFCCFGCFDIGITFFLVFLMNFDSEL